MTDNNCCKCTTPQYTLTLNAQGPQGITGKNGQDGISPTINVNTNNASTYILEISDINGTFTTPNLKGGLPSGGSTGQVLTKYSNNDGEVNWQYIPQGTTTTSGVFLANQLTDFSEPTVDEEGVTTYTSSSAVTPAGLVDLLGNIPTTMDNLFNGAGQLCLTDRSNNSLTLPWMGAENYFQSPSYHVINNNEQHFAGLYHEGGQYDIIVGAGIWGGNLYLDGANIYKGHDTTTKIIDSTNVATTTTTGIVKPDGTTITVDTDGTLHGASTYNLPIATADTLGGVKIGNGLSITDDGTLSATGGTSNLNNITDTDSGVAITDNNSGLTYPQTINITTANENEGYSYIECDHSGSGFSTGIKFNINELTLMGGSLNSTLVGGAGFKLNFESPGLNPHMIIGEPVFLKGRQDGTSRVTNLTALDFTHAIQESNTFKSGGFFIFDKQTSYTGTFTTNGILFTAGDEPSIKFTNSTSNNGVWTDNVNATVLTDKTGILYKALTEAEYTALGTKSENTIYRLTDTNKVYLGSIELTGGSGGLTPVDTAGLGLGAATGGYVGTTTVTVTNPDEEGT